jgi:hypothetical protein
MSHGYFIESHGFHIRGHAVTLSAGPAAPPLFLSKKKKIVAAMPQLASDSCCFVITRLFFISSSLIISRHGGIVSVSLRVCSTFVSMLLFCFQHFSHLIMESNISSPLRPAGQKRSAADSSLLHQIKYNCNQSEIARKWWSKKKSRVKALEKKVKEQEREISQLREDCDSAHALLEAALEKNRNLESIQKECRAAREEVVTLQAALDEKRPIDALLGSLDSCGGLKKIDDKSSQLIAISTLLVSFLGVIMKNTHPITRLHAVCEVLFDRCLFGIEATQAVLHDLYKKQFLMSMAKYFFHGKYCEKSIYLLVAV